MHPPPSHLAWIAPTQWVPWSVALLAVSAAPQSSPAKAPAAASAPVRLLVEPRAEITRAELEAHVGFLASDELAGRFTGSPGADRAARYIALVLERQGIEPAGDAGSFLQAVPMWRARPAAIPELSFGTRSGETLTAVYGRDFDSSEDDLALASAPVIVAKSEADIPRDPDHRSALFVDAPSSKRRQWLASAGHPGGDGFALLIQAGSEKPGTPISEIADAGMPMREREGKRTGWIRARGTLLERLRQGDVTHLSLTSHVERESIAGANVVGKIRGVTDEAVVISAHYDHLHEARASPATGADGQVEDTIFNGADDDASGVAAVLELAGALAAGPPPQRTLIFLLATGEEVGLLGTQEYLDRPVVPLPRTVANLNFEMIGRPDELVGGAGAMWLTGHELTNLGPAYVAAGLAVKPDPRPDQHFFQRSDNYAFVLRGVVGQTFSTYNLHTDYHTPRDEADRLDFAHMEACTKVGLDAVRMVADGRLSPAWLEGRQPKTR